MKNNSFYVGLALFLAVLTLGAFFYFALHGLNDGLFVEQVCLEQPEAASADHDTVRILQEQLDKFEDRLLQLESQRATQTEKAAQEAMEGTPDQPHNALESGAPEDASAGLISEPALSDEAKDAIREYLREESLAVARKQEKPKKRVSEVAAELGLDFGQEQQLQELHKNLADEMMKLLFSIEDHRGLEELRRQLDEAQYNPELRDMLGELVLLNYPKMQNALPALVVKSRANAKKFFNWQQLQELDKYDLDPADSGWPDLGDILFPAETQKN